MILLSFGDLFHLTFSTPNAHTFICVDSQPNEYNNTTNGIYLTLSAMITTSPWCETKGEICVNETNGHHNVKQTEKVMLKEIIAPLSCACDLRSCDEIIIFVIPNYKSFVLHHT